MNSKLRNTLKELRFDVTVKHPGHFESYEIDEDSIAEAEKAIEALIASKVEEARSKEAELLNAVGLMYAQYCREPYGHHFMVAGEAAIEVLEDYGVHAEDWQWTDKSYDKLEEVVKSLQSREQDKV